MPVPRPMRRAEFQQLPGTKQLGIPTEASPCAGARGEPPSAAASDRLPSDTRGAGCFPSRSWRSKRNEIRTVGSCTVTASKIFSFPCAAAHARPTSYT